jgi:hypothetical protein
MTRISQIGPGDVYVELKRRIEWVGDAAEGRSLAPQRRQPPQTADRLSLACENALGTYCPGSWKDLATGSLGGRALKPLVSFDRHRAL